MEISKTHNIPTHFPIHPITHQSLLTKTSKCFRGYIFLSPESTWFILIHSDSPPTHVLLLVQTGKGSIHSLVQAPALRHGDVQLICSLQGQIAGLNGTSVTQLRSNMDSHGILQVYIYMPIMSTKYNYHNELYTALKYSVHCSSDKETVAEWRFKYEVKAMSTLIPSDFSRPPADLASPRPFADKSTSSRPQFRRFFMMFFR